MASLYFKGVTISYPYLFEPRSDRPVAGKTPKPPKYSCTLLIPHEVDIKEQQMAVLELMKSKNENAEVMIKEGLVRWPFITKNLKKDGKTPRFDASRFKCFINAWSYDPPGVVDRYVDPTTGKVAVLRDRKKIYSGCIVNALVNPYWYVNDGMGVSFGLQHIQWWDDGERLDNRIAAEDAFQGEALPEGDISRLGDNQPPSSGPGSKGAALNDLFT